jgi:hypothetical protein
MDRMAAIETWALKIQAGSEFTAKSKAVAALLNRLVESLQRNEHAPFNGVR